MLIRSLISKLAQGIMIIAVVYAGSFVLMEETSEKTERTEAEKEALHFQYNSSKSTRLVKSNQDSEPTSQSPLQEDLIQLVHYSYQVDFNVNHIYFTSYLDYTQAIS